MERLLKAFKKFKQEMHEMENGDKMKNMSPHTTIYDLQHHFSEKTGKASKILDRMLLKEPEVYHTALTLMLMLTQLHKIKYCSTVFCLRLYLIYIWLI